MRVLILIIGFLTGACSTPSVYHRGEKLSDNFAISESYIKYEKKKLDSLSNEGDGLANCHLGDSRKGLKLIATQFSIQHDASYLNKIGTCYLLRNDYNKAMFYYQVALGKSNNSPQVYNNIGILNAKLGHFKQAIKYLKQATIYSPASLTPRYNLAAIYIKYGQYESALKELRVVYAKSPYDIDLISAMATAYLLKGDFKLANHYFSKINASRAKWADIAYYRAQILLSEGKNLEAKKIIMEAKEIYQSDLQELKETLVNRIEENADKLKKSKGKS